MQARKKSWSQTTNRQYPHFMQLHTAQNFLETPYNFVSPLKLSKKPTLCITLWFLFSQTHILHHSYFLNSFALHIFLLCTSDQILQQFSEKSSITLHHHPSTDFSENSVKGKKGYDRMVKIDSTDEELEYSFRLSSTTIENASDAPHSNEDITSPLSVDIHTSSSSPPPAVPSWDKSLATSPIAKSPWSSHVEEPQVQEDSYKYTGLMGSLVREEGHIYSLAATGDLLYTGSDSKNIRVWKNQKEFSGFKSNSGLVKAIIIAGEKIFTGHQDGKIRLWRVSSKNPSIHKRVGSLPTFKAVFKSSMNPSSYRRSRNVVWLKHFDAISCLSLNEDKTLLYSASWDRTIKVWRVSNSKCLESVNAHEDAVNSVVAGFDGLVFTGSADGTVKVWRRELQGKGTKHFFSQTLLKQECAVTALAVDPHASFLYCGSSDGVVNFWERASLLSHGGVLRGHKLAVLCLASSSNLIFSGSADTNICVWTRDGEGKHSCLSVLSGHTGPVKCLAVEDDREEQFGGDRRWVVYSGSLDKSVKIWRVSANMAPILSPQQRDQAPFVPSVQHFSRPSQKN